MKSHLVINNVGPLQHVDIELNKVNVVIGPQSSGKSTIAKIVSFCQWLEKSIVANQGKQHIDADFMRIQLISYHGFNTYFYEQSYIHYESDFIDFEFHSTADFSIEIKNLQDGVMTKVAYIPSERTYVGIPNISTLSLENKYTRQFIFDWLSLRNKYNSSNHLGILDLGVEFYYDENFGDAIKLENGKAIHLSEASSGLQALIPMLVYVDYVTNWIYKNSADISYEKYAAQYKLFIESLYKESPLSKGLDLKHLEQEVQKKDGKEKKLYEGLLQNLKTLQQMQNLYELQDAVIKNYPSSQNPSSIVDFWKKIKYYSTKLTIEEGEMNVFPSTQYSLVKHLVASMDFERGDTLFLTTHSPYIMTSINNLIQAGNAAGKDDSEVNSISDIVPIECWLHYEDVSAWSVSNGTVVSTNDDEYRLISAEALDKASELISDDFSKLL